MRDQAVVDVFTVEQTVLRCGDKKTLDSHATPVIGTWRHRKNPTTRGPVSRSFGLEISWSVLGGSQLTVMWFLQGVSIARYRQPYSSYHRHVCLSVCPAVFLSHAGTVIFSIKLLCMYVCMYCVKMTQARITKSSPTDSVYDAPLLPLSLDRFPPSFPQTRVQVLARDTWFHIPERFPLA